MAISKPRKAAALAGNARSTQGEKPTKKPRIPCVWYTCLKAERRLPVLGSWVVRGSGGGVD